jgi:Polysaccharide lyase
VNHLSVVLRAPCLLFALSALSAGCGGGDAAQDSGETSAAHWGNRTSDAADNLSLALGIDEGGDQASSQDTLDIPRSTFKILATDTVVAVNASDIAVQARASIAFANQKWGSIQCNGKILGSQSIPESGIHGSVLSGGQSLRFGRIRDATAASGYAFQFTLNPSDPLTAGSHRCELGFGADSTRGIPRESAFWHALSIQLPDWRSTTDEQSLAQWHAGDNSGGLLPVYTLLVRGKVMRLVLRYDTSAAPSRSTAKTLVVWSTDQWVPGQWLNFVTQALVSQDANKGPFIKTWMNGQPIVSYTGPVGYNQPNVQSYAKHGVYHWVDSTNPWDMSIPTRQVKMKRPLIVRDPQFKYSHGSIVNLLNAD